jgi:endonuclease/exonuclease/phosphatase family metal-dependent hydrolase
MQNFAEFSIMSFNIAGDSSDRGIHFHWDTRSVLIAEIIENHSPDLIGFQEVSAENLSFFRKRLNDYEIYPGLKTVWNDSTTSIYNPICWKSTRFEMCGSGGFYISETPNEWSKGWDSMHVRGASWVRLKCVESESEFVHVNAHLDHRGEKARVQGSNVIVEQISRLREEGLTILLTGDFNSRAWAPPAEDPRLYPPPLLPNALPPGRTVYNVFINSGFKDTYIEAGYVNKLDMNTYHDCFGKNFPPAALRIDWILYLSGGQKLYTQDFAIIYKSRSPFYPSDHYPVMAELSLKMNS